jgi:hypothetical protein
MTSTFTTNKRIEKPASGDYPNAWAAPVNADWDVIDTAFGGTTSLNAVGASGTVVLTTAQYRPPLIVISGSITDNINYQLPAGIGGYWFVFNATTTGVGGPYAISFSSAGGGTTVILAQGYTTAVICDGVNVGRADTNLPVAGGSTTQVQFNSAGALAGSANLTWNGTTLTSSSFTGPLTGNASTATSATTATTATTATYASTVTGTALAIGYLKLPQNSQSTAYVAVAGDVGKHIYTTSNVTLNPSVFSAGDAFVIVNSNTATTSITVIAGSGVVLRIAGTTTSGTPRTLAPNGVISVLCVVGGATPTFLLSGAGLS